MVNDWIADFKDISQNDIDKVGGKNASLGEMIGHLSELGVAVPDGFAITAKCYRDFLKANKLDTKIKDSLSALNVDDVQALAKVGQQIRRWITESPLPSEIEKAIREAYQTFLQQRQNTENIVPSFALRSSATAEDLPEASFAGQQETLLNVMGIENILKGVKVVFASLYNDRVITYRSHHGFSHEHIAISVGVQEMVRSDLGAAGVMFTLDTESGFQEVVLINAAYGLGELLVQGAINPDEFYVSKQALNKNKNAVIRKTLGSKLNKMVYCDEPTSNFDHRNNEAFPKNNTKVVNVSEKDQKRFVLTDQDLESLAKQALIIEKHYGCPMDIEWAKDGLTGKIYIVQARPETVAAQAEKACFVLERYALSHKSKVLVEGRSVGQRIGKGKARVLKSHQDMHQLQVGEVLVTDMTDPDWEPVMKRAAAVITNRGGRTCHAAIIARELGIPAVVGCGVATETIKTGQAVTVSCAEGDTGYVYEGEIDYELKRFDLKKLPKLPFKIMITIGNPERAFDLQKLPNAGVGLARLEFIINQTIGIHPRACIEFSTLSEEIQEEIKEKISGYESPVSFYIDKLAEGIATLAAAFWPKPVIVRLSDFKSNEYANLIGGLNFEPKEENPMLGFRGASRYLSREFEACFALECQAVKKVREEQGFTNVVVMIPFVRTPTEAKEVIDSLALNGLKRGENDLKIIMMCEIPSNVILANEFLTYFDGFSIGSNDLTQLTLGLDRDSGLVAHLFDERNGAVLALLHQAILACKAANKSIGICGQGPSDYPDLAKWLIDKGIESMSLNPDSVISTWLDLS